jgi:transposase
MKFVAPLSEADKKKLGDCFNHHPSPRVRQRAHSILLSERGYTLNEIANIYQVDRDVVSNWLDRWQEAGCAGLPDRPRSGHPPKLSPSEQELVLASLQEDPRSIKKAAEKVLRETGKNVSQWTLKRIARKMDLRWKRMRKSHKSKRDETLFQQAQAEIEDLKAQDEAGEIELVYFDETGFSLTPVVPYAWQPIGQTLEIPASYSRRLNVMGFFSQNHTFHSCTVEGRVDSERVINCFDQFAQTLTKTTVVLIDNAPTHTSHKFKARLAEWASQGLIVKYLPTYSAELNLIEIVWRFIKYQWLPLAAYLSFKSLKDAVQDVLDGIGSKYCITFA